MPPMFEAAMPVLAVTETAPFFFACFFRSAVIMARRRRDFPVPITNAGRKREVSGGHVNRVIDALEWYIDR